MKQSDIVLDRLKYHFGATAGGYLPVPGLPFMQEFLVEVEKLAAEKARLRKWAELEIAEAVKFGRRTPNGKIYAYDYARSRMAEFGTMVEAK